MAGLGIRGCARGYPHTALDFVSRLFGDQDAES